MPMRCAVKLFEARRSCREASSFQSPIYGHMKAHCHRSFASLNYRLLNSPMRPVAFSVRTPGCMRHDKIIGRNGSRAKHDFRMLKNIWWACGPPWISMHVAWQDLEAPYFCKDDAITEMYGNGKRVGWGFWCSTAINAISRLAPATAASCTTPTLQRPRPAEPSSNLHCSSAWLRWQEYMCERGHC